MLATLETIAQTEGLPFRYGYRPDENILADNQITDRWLYQEGYLNGTIRLDADNSISLTYTVNLWLLTLSALPLLPAERGPKLIALLDQLIRIYRRVGAFGSLGPASFIEGINLFDRNADGIRLSFSFTPFSPITVC